VGAARAAERGRRFVDRAALRRGGAGAADEPQRGWREALLCALSAPRCARWPRAALSVALSVAAGEQEARRLRCCCRSSAPPSPSGCCMFLLMD
jgi:hypothetical protein